MWVSLKTRKFLVYICICNTRTKTELFQSVQTHFSFVIALIAIQAKDIVKKCLTQYVIALFLGCAYSEPVFLSLNGNRQHIIIHSSNSNVASKLNGYLDPSLHHLDLPRPLQSHLSQVKTIYPCNGPRDQLVLFLRKLSALLFAHHRGN